MAWTIEKSEKLRRYDTEEYLVADLKDALDGEIRRTRMTNFEVLNEYGFKLDYDNQLYIHPSGVKITIEALERPGTAQDIHRAMHGV